MRQCFLHLGVHKTGSTSIQHLLARGSSALLDRGYLSPQNGHPESQPGQHNLAWEITNDYRFKVEYGTIAGLIKKIKDRPEDVILSSEDFECSLHHEARFAEFISLLKSCGFTVNVILYVRNQLDYLPRIYLALLHSGLNLTFAEALNSVFNVGRLSWRDWIINFDFCDLLTRLSKTGNVNVIVRSYDQSRASICRDFLSLFNLTLQDLQVDTEPFENVSSPLKDYLFLFLRNRIGRTLSEHESEAITAISSSGAGTIRLSPAIREQIFVRFRESNRRLLAQHGIPEPELADQDERPGGLAAPYVDQLFTEELEASFRELTASAADTGR